MKQFFIKKINKIDLELFVFWSSLETETKENIKIFLFITFFLIAFLLGAFFDNLTLQKINL